MARIPLMAGNWKMNKTVEEAIDLVMQLKAGISGVKGVEVAVAPAFTALYAVSKELKDSAVHLAAQNMFWEEKGAFTGEVSPLMLKEMSCAYVIIGHSERRQFFGETDETVNRRMKMVIAHGMRPIFCIGETLKEREENRTFLVLERQIEGGLKGIKENELERRIELVEAKNASGEERAMPEAPSGVPENWDEHMELMFDLQVVALQSDMTRVITFITGVDQENRTHPESGSSKSWHGASHHGNVPTAIMDYHLINTYRLSKQAYFLERMKNTMEGDKSLLDKTVIIWGSSMGDPNLHNHRRCPLLLMGKANGLLEGNTHLRAPQGTPMANVFLSLLQTLGHDDVHRFGDSTGAFPLTTPRGV